MVKPMHEQPASVKLLTILNVQSAKPPSSKKRSTSTSTSTQVNGLGLTRDWNEIAKKANKKQKITTTQPISVDKKEEEEDKVEVTTTTTLGEQDADEEEEEEDSFKSHFGSHTKLVENRKSKASTEEEQEGEEEELEWKRKKLVVKGLGEMQLCTPKDATQQEEGDKSGLNLYNSRLLDKLRSTTPDKSLPTNQRNWLNVLSSYRDLSYTKLELGERHEEIRQSCSIHAMNHVLKTRTRILKNNEHLSRQAATAAAASSSSLSTSKKLRSPSTQPQPSRDTTDQGFTRPKVLILCPFRNSALSWTQHLLNYSLVPQIENYERFLGEYNLPSGVEDKLVSSESSQQYPLDHVETFKGNIDDSFRVGFKVNRKQVKVFSEFYQADLIVASPLGLRTSIEKEDDSDFLSSIEIVIVDQMDVMLMQNWEHVQFVMDRLNKMPEEDHGCDFSRVKPWYLDGKSPYLRQSILLSRYQTPETTSLFNHHLMNQQGKLRTIERYDGCLEEVPRGLRQVWNRFECGDVSEEDDRRFEWFTQKTLPSLMKSAISSQQTIIFIPSYFDFVRVKRYLSKKLNDFSFTSISEYTPTPDVSRARGAFFSGKKKFLLVTERFHFFRRYRIRGAKTVVFYAPPSHPSYYPEFLSFPFTSSTSTGLQLDQDVEVDESELSSHVVFSKYDFLRMERIVGTKDAKRMCGIGNDSQGGGIKAESRFTFV